MVLGACARAALVGAELLTLAPSPSVAGLLLTKLSQQPRQDQSSGKVVPGAWVHAEPTRPRWAPITLLKYQKKKNNTRGIQSPLLSPVFISVQHRPLSPGPLGMVLGAWWQSRGSERGARLTGTEGGEGKGSGTCRRTEQRAGRAAYHLRARVLGAGALRAWGEETPSTAPQAGTGRGSLFETRRGKGTCWEGGGLPCLCWQPGKAGPGCGREERQK